MGEAVTIGLDVGGTKVAGGLVGERDDLVATLERPTLVAGARDPGLRVTLELAQELAEEARDRGLRVDGIGAGFPEYVDRGGRLRSHEVLAWTVQPAELLARLGPVTVESDVRCAALGEAACGVARGLADFAYVTVGTGLSYALVDDGRIRTGARGEAIAFGELEVSRRVDTPTVTSLERFASGEAIRERYVATTGTAVDGAAAVFDLADGGDAEAASIVRAAGQALGEGLAALVWLLDPGAVVLGGGVAAASGPWRAALLAAYDERLALRPHPPPVLWAKLGATAGIIGAAIAHRARLTR